MYQLVQKILISKSMSAHEYGDAKRIEISVRMLIFSFNAATVICRVQKPSHAIRKSLFVSQTR